MPYLQRPGLFVVLVSAFLLIFVPLTTLMLVPNSFEFLPYLVVAEGVGLGVTHFFITLALYGQSRNLDHFASTSLNRLIYFVVPALILLGFASFAALGGRAAYPAFGAVLFGAVRLFDFYHVGRQSFGMLQLWKRPIHSSGARSAVASEAAPAVEPRDIAWLRPAENVFFVGMALFQWGVYLSGGYFKDTPYAGPVAAVFAVSFAVLAFRYLRAVDHGAGRAALIPLAYLTMQAICAAVAVYQTRLYLIGLTLHYVEYHLMMVPRCFYSPLDPSRRIDRISGFLRGRAVLFYALLLAVVVAFEARNYVPPDLSGSTLFFVHIFDGIFLIHYFVEAFLWRFRHPFYGRELGALYGAPWQQARQAALDSATPPALGKGVAMAGGALLAAALGFAYLQGGLQEAATSFKHSVADPMHAENHVRWGIQLAEQGEVAQARRHLQEAVERDPDSRQARSLLDTLDQHLRKRSSHE